MRHSVVALVGLAHPGRQSSFSGRLLHVDRCRSQSSAIVKVVVVAALVAVVMGVVVVVVVVVEVDTIAFVSVPCA